MKGLESPGYMYIYIYTSLYISGWMAHFVSHTQRFVCGITDRLDGPFFTKGRERERMEQEGERIERGGGI